MKTTKYFVEYIVETKDGERYIETEKDMILVSKGNQTNDVYTIDEKLIPGKLYMTEKYASAHRIVKFIRLKQNSFGTDDEQADPECLVEFVNESRKFIHLSELIELQWPYTTNILQEDIRGWEAAGEIIPQQKHNRLRINSKLKHYWKKIKLYF